jgi:hypothetical protein
MLPRARKKGLIIETLDDELLVYDLKTDHAHCLNPTATLIWRYCDGKTPVSSMTRKLSAALGKKASDDIVQLALLRLRAARLIEAEPRSAKKPTYNRRELLRNIGKAAAIALPAVASIVAPTAAQAASCVPSAWCTTALANRKYDGVCCCLDSKGKSTGQCDANKGKCVNGGGC